MRLAGAGAALLLAQGCSTLVIDDWHDQPSHPVLPAVHIQVAEHDLPRICRTHPGALTYGCAVRDVKANVCLIYTGANPAQWLMDHERKHCAGWDHGPNPTRLAAADPAFASQ